LAGLIFDLKDDPVSLEDPRGRFYDSLIQTHPQCPEMDAFWIREQQRAHCHGSTSLFGGTAQFRETYLPRKI
jgi:hypothetical protein